MIHYSTTGIYSMRYISAGKYSVNRSPIDRGMGWTLDYLFTFSFPFHLVMPSPSAYLFPKDRKTLHDLQNTPPRNHLEGVLYKSRLQPNERTGSEATNGSCRLMPTYPAHPLLMPSWQEPKVSSCGIANGQSGVYVLSKVNLSRYAISINHV